MTRNDAINKRYAVSSIILSKLLIISIRKRMKKTFYLLIQYRDYALRVTDTHTHTQTKK